MHHFRTGKRTKRSSAGTFSTRKTGLAIGDSPALSVANPPLEKDIKRHIIEWLFYQKCFCWVNSTVGIWDQKKNSFRKLTGTGQMRGVSDILGIWKGRPLAIEVKRSGGRLSIHQQAFLLKFAEAGGIAMVAHSVEDVESILSTIRQEGTI